MTNIKRIILGIFIMLFALYAPFYIGHLLPPEWYIEGRYWWSLPTLLLILGSSIVVFILGGFIVLTKGEP